MKISSIDCSLFVANRQRLAQLMKPGSLAVVNSNDVFPTNADGTLALVANSDLFYLTGIEQEESMLLLFPDADDESNREILFLREPIKELELWEGHKLTREEARQTSGITNIQWLSAFPRLFHRLMCECEHAYLNSNEHKRAVITTETREARFIRETMRSYPLHDYCRLAPLMHRLRVVKSTQEIDLIRHAAEITGQAFQRVLKMVQPGVNEKEVEAEFAYEFIRNHGRFAYLPIIATGKNACALHYIKNNQECRDGDLLLLDVAATHQNYNSDMTRTIPVNGRFTKRQRDVYNAVLRTLRACSDALRPGKKWKEWQREAEQFIAKECVDLGLLKMSQVKRQDPASPAVKKYFMHGVGHPLGLDVHDVGIITEPMQAGWVMTVEPAIYLPEEGFAVRLENNVVIGETENDDLMAHIPIEVDELEALLNRKRR